MSSVEGVKTNNTFSFIPNIIPYKVNTPLVLRTIHSFYDTRDGIQTHTSALLHLRRCKFYYSALEILLFIRNGGIFFFLLQLQGCDHRTEASDDAVLLGVVEVHLADMGTGVVQLFAGLVQHEV